MRHLIDPADFTLEETLSLMDLAYDPAGSLRIVSDASGAVVKRVDYDSFGNILADSNPSFTVPFGFAGGLQRFDRVIR